jgi:hypothetical protein
MNTKLIGLVSVDAGQDAQTEEGNLVALQNTSPADGPITPW